MAVERADGVLNRAGHPSMYLSVEVTPLKDPRRDVVGLLYAVHDVTPFRGLEVELRKSNEERQSALDHVLIEAQACGDRQGITTPRQTDAQAIGR